MATASETWFSDTGWKTTFVFTESEEEITINTDGYPINRELKRIHTWSIDNEDAICSLLAHVHSLWKYADAGYWRQRGRTYRISTAGWSGNESIIGVLQENRLFWILCWQSSRRGGHYVFRIPKIRPAAATPAESPTTRGHPTTHRRQR